MDRPVIFDVDGHLCEDWLRLQQLTDAPFRAFAPQIIDMGPSEVLSIGGLRLQQPPGMTWGDTNTRGGLDAANRKMGKWDDSEPVGMIPEARLAMMDEHGVYAAVIFPSLGLFAGALQPPQIAAGVCRGVNRYIAEFCAADPARLKNTATVPIGDVELARREARHAVKELGAIAIFAPSGVHGPQPLYHPYYDPLFDEVADLGVPFITHSGAAAMHKGLGVDRFHGAFAPFHITQHCIEAQLACLGFLSYGVLDRRPQLKVGFFEAGAAWAPCIVDKMTEKFETLGWMLPELTRSPRETFTAQCLVTVETDEAILGATLDFFDGNCVAWSSDVPHFDCEEDGKPDHLFEHPDLTDDRRRRLVGGNGLDFFGLTEMFAQAAAE